MMYPFLTLEDGTKIVHSEALPDGRVKVYVEKPDEKDGFHNAVCFLPGCEWKEINGFSESAIRRYQEIIASHARRILEKVQADCVPGSANSACLSTDGSSEPLRESIT